MNAADKKKLLAIVAALDDAKSELEDLAVDLESEWEDKSEKWQESDAGVTAQEEYEAMRTCADNIDSEIGDLNRYADA
jgi:hypothetical protein